MVKILKIEQTYFLKSDKALSLSLLLNLMEKKSGMREGSFAQKYVVKIFRDLLVGAIDLGDRYCKYYSSEYVNFSEYLYKKELIDQEVIDRISLMDNETLWKLRFTTNNYSIKDLIGYQDENLEIFNQTLEYICNEN